MWRFVQNYSWAQKWRLEVGGWEGEGGGGGNGSMQNGPAKGLAQNLKSGDCFALASL